MYLKSIEIHGFKSFANRTVLKFNDGITGIVGPNGSGKSNVADAVRWVLGEQRVKQLRGGSMQDVIFAGTQTRKPLGYASVAITLDNSDHMLPVSYEEVTVCRRLYRSGESEYLMNGTNCRLKDIYELFYDTGIGKEGYSIIGQGQVERILNGKPEERRELFDEAAGIVKFKRRKIESMRKLESEESNLVRVNDILSELGRQIGPLEKQSQKAKIYLKKRDELKAYDVNFFLEELKDTKVKLEESRSAHETSQAELTQVKEEVEQIRLRYESTVEEIARLEEEIAALSQEITSARLREQECDSQISLYQEKIRSAMLDEGRLKERAETIQSELSSKESDRESAQLGERSILEHSRELEKQVAAIEEERLSILTRISGEESRLAQLKDRRIEFLTRKGELNAEIRKFDTMQEQIYIRRSELDRKALVLRGEEDEQKKELTRLRMQCGRIGGEIMGLTEKSNQANEELTVVQDKLTGLNQKFDQDQQAFHRESSRLESLRNIAERYDGYGSSIKKVMEQKAHNPGILGVVADLIRTDKRYETAMETALGGSIQNIVTKDEDTAKKMIGYLKTNRLGRATFLPLTAMNGSTLKERQALSETGVIGLASDLAETDPEYRKMAAQLLGRTIIVDTIDHAAAIARKYRYSLRMVTLEGDLLAPGGSMTGGAFKNSSNLLGRRREIDELTQLVARRSASIEQLKTQIDEVRSRRNQLRDQLRDYAGRLQEKYIEQNTADMKRREMEDLQERIAASNQEIQEEHARSQVQIEDIEEQIGSLEEKLRELEANEAELAGQEQSAQTSLDELRASDAQKASKLEEMRIEKASGEQKAAYLKREQERLSGEIEALKQEREQISMGKEGRLHITREYEEQIEQITLQRNETAGVRSKQEEKAGELTARKEQLSGKQQTFFKESEALTDRSTLLDRECFRLAHQIEKLEENREQRIAYMWDEYELTPSGAEALRRDDLGSKTEWKRQMAALRKEIRDLGNVNVASIEEYREVSERYEFLSAQQQDLIKARDALEKIIGELDDAMRRQFKEQFAKIAEEFDKSFRELFGGGQGTLELVEDEDILEAGVRIIAQPPGKKLQNMMQLSGGEKALAAIALLFAIQNLKPSPFCLLDEIEAALDESNVDRYAGYLHKLTKHTQFIIITHRRGTMAAADRLYGVTMQEKGVSALVSVDLIEEQLDQ